MNSFILYEDVLLLIFEHLNDKDLIQCEAVCRQWRQVLLTGPPWKKWLNKQRNTSPAVRQFWQKCRPDEQNLKFEDWRAIYRNMLFYLKELDKNWRTGRCITRIIPLDDYCLDLQISNNWIAWMCFDDFLNNLEMKCLDRTTMHVNTFPIDLKGYLGKVENNVVIFQCREGLKFVDCNDGHVINEVPVTGDPIIGQCCFNGKLLVAPFVESNLVRVWRVEGYSKITFVKDLLFGSFLSMTMDDRYLLIRDGGNIHFICTKTLKVERTFAVESNEVAYEGGLLFIIAENWRVRIWDVASETYLRDLPIPGGYWMLMTATRSFSNSTVCANSKYVVVNCWNLEGSKHQESKLFVYDLEAIRNDNIEIVPLYHIPSTSKVYSVFMDETHITHLRLNSEKNGLEVADIDFNPLNKPSDSVQSESLQISLTAL
jgi:F-box-like